MSRIGKKPIVVPESVAVNLGDGLIHVKGPRGELSQEFSRAVRVEMKNHTLTCLVERPNDRKNRALWGLTRMLIANAIEGVTKGFQKKLEMEGIGFKAQVSGKKLTLNVGFSHPVEFGLPEGIEVSLEKNTITLAGVDKQVVGETAARIRSIRKPEPYKGKGIRYQDEVIRRKAGKVVKGAGS